MSLISQLSLATKEFDSRARITGGHLLLFLEGQARDMINCILCKKAENRCVKTVMARKYGSGADQGEHLQN